MMPALRQALKILQMAHLELAEWIMAEIEKNPLLEHVQKIPLARGVPPEEALLEAKPSLRESLFQQARDQFEKKREREIAFSLIDQLDERGFFSGEIGTPEQEKILEILQTFEPLGICARNLRECFLNQMKGESLAKVLVRDHFQDFLEGKFSLIRKKLRVSSEKMQKAIEAISHLSVRPSSGFDFCEAPLMIADLTVKMREGDWILEIGDEELPSLSIRSDINYLMAQLDSEEKNTVCGWIKSAKHLRQALLRRKIMLNTIGDLLIQTQAPYFSHEGEILPLSIRDLAQELKVHPSTAWRAVTDKVLACPRGMIPLKMFFSCEGSKNSVREILRKLINQEDRAKPLTDEALAKKLQEQGIQCARRTIAHYRNSLKLRASKRRIRI